jgi:hypothetical protein
MNQTMATTIGSSNLNDNGGRIAAIDLGEAVVLLPPGGRKKLLATHFQQTTISGLFGRSATQSWRRRS